MQHFSAEEVLLWDISGPQVTPLPSLRWKLFMNHSNAEVPLCLPVWAFASTRSPMGPEKCGRCSSPRPDWHTCAFWVQDYVFWETLTPSRINPVRSNLSCWSLEGYLEIVNCIFGRPVTFNKMSIFSLPSLVARVRPDKEGLISVSIICIPSLPPHTGTGWVRSQPTDPTKGYAGQARQQLLTSAWKGLLIRHQHQHRLNLLWLFCIHFSKQTWYFWKILLPFPSFLYPHCYLWALTNFLHLLPACPLLPLSLESLTVIPTSPLISAIPHFFASLSSLLSLIASPSQFPLPSLFVRCTKIDFQLSEASHTGKVNQGKLSSDLSWVGALTAVDSHYGW